MQPAGHLIKLSEPGTDPFDAPAGIQKGVEAALKLFDNLGGVGERIRRARLAQFQQALFGAGQDLVGRFLLEASAVDGLLRSENDLAEERLVLNDLDVAVQVGDPGQTVVERNEI